MDARAVAPSRMPKVISTALLAALPLLMAVEFSPKAALAAEPLSPSAERLFGEGLKLAHSGDCVRARDKFTESYAADPAPGTLINWALCEEKLGRSATALELLRLADHALPQNHPKRAGMVKHMDALAKRAPILRLRMTSALPPGATVLMDGAMLDPNLLAQGALGDPGPHVIEMRAPGREDRRYEVTLSEGTTLEVTVEPGPPRTASPGGGSPNAAQAGNEPSSSSTTLGWALAGGGLTAIGVGAVTGLLASSKWSEVQANCNVADKTCNDAGIQASNAGDTLSTVSTVAFITGGASLAVGGYLLLTKRNAPASARLSTAVGPAMMGVRLGGEF